MSSWNMNDGSALTGTMTFTNGNATVSGSGTNYDPEVKVGDIIISAGGVKHRVKAVASDTSLTLTETFSGSTENGVAATVTRPPINFASAAPHIDNNVLGITNAESLAGVDNITTISVGTTTLGTYDRIGGNTYRGSAPSVTVAAPTARTITQANIDETTNVFTVTGHNMRTGTKLTYTSNGTNIVHSGGTLADATAVFVIRIDENTFKIASSLSNAQSGTALDITNDGNDNNSFVGDTATATATISGGKVTGITITGVGSDYQSAPTITVAAPSGTGNLDLTDSAVLIVADDEIVVPAAFYAVIETGEAVTYAQGGSGAQADLTDGTVYYLIKSATANKISLATSAENAVAGTKIDLTAVASGGTAHSFTGGTATATATLGLGADGDDNRRDMAHIGWVKKTVGTGGRAGRVHYETLVAASSISGDAEDIATPDS
jgi:hypothetical protein